MPAPVQWRVPAHWCNCSQYFVKDITISDNRERNCWHCLSGRKTHLTRMSYSFQDQSKNVWLFVHTMLMVGSPGAGKTLLARAIPGILPEMSIDESLDVTRIYSVADALPPGTPLIRHRPFRAPHHTISHAGLVGGGNWPPEALHLRSELVNLFDTLRSPTISTCVRCKCPTYIWRRITAIPREPHL